MSKTLVNCRVHLPQFIRLIRNLEKRKYQGIMYFSFIARKTNKLRTMRAKLSCTIKSIRYTKGTAGLYDPAKYKLVWVMDMDLASSDRDLTKGKGVDPFKSVNLEKLISSTISNYHFTIIENEHLTDENILMQLNK